MNQSQPLPSLSLAGMSNREAIARVLIDQTLYLEFIEKFLAKKACGRAGGRKPESTLLRGSSKIDSCSPQKEKARQDVSRWG
jgi:hypothetical protein